MITKKVIKDGISKGIVSFVKDPSSGKGTVCKIGSHWFYFGGLTAEEMDPNEFLENVPMDDVMNEVYDTLESFRQDDRYKKEYLYYMYELLANLYV